MRRHMDTSSERKVITLTRTRATSDGDGVKIQRIAGFQNPQFSPFLMIDELKADDKADYIGGFPPHPHRGIETLTYMLNGHFQHKDHMGNVGELRSGGAQWMAAGRGVIHSEMPIMTDGKLHGFQIWINQPAKDKMKPAKYHDFQPESIAEHSITTDNVVRVIAGSLLIEQNQISGPLLETGVPLVVADWRAPSGNRVEIGLNDQYQAMVYVYKGQINIGDIEIGEGQLGYLSKGEQLLMSSLHDSGVLLLAGQRIEEEIVHYGPFVMNSEQEIEQAIREYNAGVFETY